MADVRGISEWCSDQAVEEEVVVVSHGGVVEDRGHFRALGVLDQQFSGFGVRIDGVYIVTASAYPPVPSQLIVLCPIRLRDFRRAVRRTLCQQVELIHEKGLILGPGKVECLW